MQEHAFTHRDSVTIERHIDRLFDQFTDTPGCVVGIVQDGEETFAKAYGIANLEYGIPLSTSSAIYLASVSKQFTAFLLLSLVQEGKVALTDTIRVLIPELPSYADNVTFRHLLNHTSGIRDYFQLGWHAGYPDAYVYSERTVLKMLARQQRLNFAPGNEFQYSNSNYVLLAIAIQRASQMTLNEYARCKIFEPLGMSSTRFQHDHRSIVPNRADGYDLVDNQWRTSNSLLDVVGDGGMYSTIHDMLKWAANLDSRKVGEQALSSMETKSLLNDGSQIEYGMGLVMDEFRGLNRVCHAGALVGYRTNLESFPSERLTVVLLCNNDQADFSKLTTQVVEIYLGEKMLPVPTADRSNSTDEEVSYSPLTSEQLSQYAGEYWNDELCCIYRFSVENGVLYYEASTEDSIPTRSAGIDKIRCDDYGIDFKFDRDHSGTVSGFTLEAKSVRRMTFARYEL